MEFSKDMAGKFVVEEHYMYHSYDDPSLGLIDTTHTHKFRGPFKYLSDAFSAIEYSIKRKIKEGWEKSFVKKRNDLWHINNDNDEEIYFFVHVYPDYSKFPRVGTRLRGIAGQRSIVKVEIQSRRENLLLFYAQLLIFCYLGIINLVV